MSLKHLHEIIFLLIRTWASFISLGWTMKKVLRNHNLFSYSDKLHLIIYYFNGWKFSTRAFAIMKFHPGAARDRWDERIFPSLLHTAEREIYGSLISFQLCSNMHFLLKIHFSSIASLLTSRLGWQNLIKKLLSFESSAMAASFNAGNSWFTSR